VTGKPLSFLTLNETAEATVPLNKPSSDAFKVNLMGWIDSIETSISCISQRHVIVTYLKIQPCLTAWPKQCHKPCF
jgi:hypothetical protein